MLPVFRLSQATLYTINDVTSNVLRQILDIGLRMTVISPNAIVLRVLSYCRA